LGVTVIDCNATTVSVVLPTTPPKDAEIVVVPPLAPVARPVVLTVATEVLEDSQLAVEVRFLVLPSL
jgi:hypothetical protein